MWEFRRRQRDLTPDEQTKLEALFETLPELGAVYHTREGLAEIFDTAPDRKTAAARIEQWRGDLVEGGMEAPEVLGMLDRHGEGILAYFDERKTSGVVEGLNNKARVLLKRCYGLKRIASFWTRLVLDVNRVRDRLGRSIAALRGLAQGIQGIFNGLYT